MEKTKARAERDTTKISPATTEPLRQAGGFSLLEIIITISIIAFIAAMALPRIGGKGNEMRSLVRKIAVLGRDLRARAKLQGATYRIVIRMDNDQKPPVHELWIEKSRGEILNNYDPKNPPKLANPKQKPDEGEPPPTFSKDATLLRKPVELPKYLQFESVEISTLEEPITSGIVYIHYLPSGFADDAAIHIKYNEKINWTLAVDPLTGRMSVYDKFVQLEDLKAK